MSQFTAIVGLFSDYRDLSEEVNGRSSKCVGGGGVLMQPQKSRFQASAAKTETKEKLLLNLEKGKSVEAKGDVCSFYGHREKKPQVRNKSTF